jgi:hypothetical protein
MRWFRCCIWKTHLFLAGLLAVTPAWGDDALLARVRTEAPEAWDNYRTSASNINGSLIQRTKLLSDATILRENRQEIKQRKDCALVHIDRVNEKQDASGELLAYNPRYAFNLHRRARDSRWVVSEIDLSGNRAKIDEWRIDMKTTYGLTFYLGNNYLPMIVKEPGFQFTDATVVSKDGKNYVSASFIRPNADRNNAPVVSGKVVLSPDQYWMIAEFDVIQEFFGEQKKHVQNHMRGTCEYKLGSGGLPVINKHILRADIFTPGRGPVEERFEFNFDDQPARDEAEFTLSAFGLPEPRALGGSLGTPWFLLIAVGAAVFLIAGTVISWLRWRMFGAKPA